VALKTPPRKPSAAAYKSGIKKNAALIKLPVKRKSSAAKKQQKTRSFKGLKIGWAIRSASSMIAAIINNNYEGKFYTNHLSGLLLGMVDQEKLDRKINLETKRYVYIKHVTP
jgi:hypothetical protein